MNPEALFYPHNARANPDRVLCRAILEGRLIEKYIAEQQALRRINAHRIRKDHLRPDLVAQVHPAAVLGDYGREPVCRPEHGADEHERTQHIPMPVVKIAGWSLKGLLTVRKRRGKCIGYQRIAPGLRSSPFQAPLHGLSTG